MHMTSLAPRVGARARRLVLYASELAALTGRNKYKGRASAAVEVWRRTDPASFATALKRSGMAFRDDGETVRQIGLDVGIAEASRAGSEQEATAAATALLDEPLVPHVAGPGNVPSRAPGGDVPGENVPARDAPGNGTPDHGQDECDTGKQGGSTGAMHALITTICAPGSPRAKTASFVRSVEQLSGGPLSSAAKCTLASGAAQLMRQAETAGGEFPPTRVDSDLPPRAIFDGVHALVGAVKVRDCPRVAGVVQSAVNRARGIAHEAEAVAAYEESCGAEVQARNAHFYQKNIGSADAPCWIGGRVDGLREDRVVEVKCRRNQFFSFLPLYEKVQIHAYMVLTGHLMCDVVQKFGRGLRTETHDFDDVFWSGVRACTVRCWQNLEDVLERPDSQDQLLREFAQEVAK